MQTRSATQDKTVNLTKAVESPVTGKNALRARARRAIAIPEKSAASNQKPASGSKRRSAPKSTKPPSPSKESAQKKRARKRARKSTNQDAVIVLHEPALPEPSHNGSVLPNSSKRKRGNTRKQRPSLPSTLSNEVEHIDLSADSPPQDDARRDDDEEPLRKRRRLSVSETSSDGTRAAQTSRSPALAPPTAPRASSLFSEDDTRTEIEPGAIEVPSITRASKEALPDNERDLLAILDNLRHQCSRVQERLQACRGTQDRSRTSEEVVFMDLTEGPDSVDDDSVSSLPQDTPALVSYLRKENEKLQHQLSEQTTELREVRTTSDTRLKDLQHYQALNSTADNYSKADCIRAVEKLNKQLDSFCLTIVDLVTSDPTSRYKSTTLSKQREGYIKGHDPKLGAFLLEKIAANRRQEDPTMLMQSFLQQALATRFYKLLVDWHWDDVRSNLRDVHDDIRQHEPQVVSGRWRVLTRSRTKVHDEAISKRMREDLYELVENYIVVHGWKLNEKATVCIQDSILTLQKCLVYVEKTIFQGFWSADWELFIVKFGCAFDPSSMQDGDNDPDSVPGPQKAAFSTLLGLRTFDADTKERSVVVKTQVQLLSTIDAVLSNE